MAGIRALSSRPTTPMPQGPSVATIAATRPHDLPLQKRRPAPERRQAQRSDCSGPRTCVRGCTVLLTDIAEGYSEPVGTTLARRVQGSRTSRSATPNSPRPVTQTTAAARQPSVHRFRCTNSTPTPAAPVRPGARSVRSLNEVRRSSAGVSKPARHRADAVPARCQGNTLAAPDPHPHFEPTRNAVLRSCCISCSSG